MTREMTSLMNSSISKAAIAVALLGTLGFSQLAAAQNATDASAEANSTASSDTAVADPAAVQSDASIAPHDGYSPSHTGGDTDILSRNTLSVLVDARFAVANGEKSFLDGGFGKTRFGGAADGGYKARLVPAEADILWTPRFTRSLTANVSAGYQNNHASFDLIEAYLSYLPQTDAKFSLSARAGLMWPEISLEHSTGGAWSTVNVITPSAINSWVGEETKVVGVEATLHANLGQHQLLATAGIFGFNDTAGTLLSFRGWGLHDEKATGFSHFNLPPLARPMPFIQAPNTRSTIDLDKKPGYYARLDWRPPWPMGVALFYYDNEGDPTSVFHDTLQWGWRTRFWNLALNADLTPRTHLLAQGMTGSTIMGLQIAGVPWVHTKFRSAFVSITQDVGAKTALTGRVEAFGTREHGSLMDHAGNSEDGWSATFDVRHNIAPNLTGFVEALHVKSTRGLRVLDGLDPTQSQNVFQISLRYKI